MMQKKYYFHYDFARKNDPNVPKTSIRQLSQQMNLSVGTRRTMLHKNLHLYPYCVTPVQELKRADYPRRLHLCNWLVDNVGNNVLIGI
jgi:hypothetical protein